MYALQGVLTGLGLVVAVAGLIAFVAGKSVVIAACAAIMGVLLVSIIAADLIGTNA